MLKFPVAIANLLLLGLANGAIASGLPIQVGAYRFGSSNYIQIAQQGDRLCYQGFSSRGTLVASIVADPQRQDVYRINGADDLVLYQFDVKTLLFGSLHQLGEYTADYEFSRTNSPTMQQCLNAKTPFYKQESGMRSR